MGYLELARQQAKNAFKLAGNLVKTARLSSSKAVYDSASQDVVVSTSTVDLKCLVAYKSAKGADEVNNSLKAEITFLSEEISDISVYDTVTIGTAIWNIEEMLKDDDILKIIKAGRQ